MIIYRSWKPFLPLPAARAAASDILLLRLASARTPRSTRSEIRLRRELLTRAVQTESRRLILWRACVRKRRRRNSHCYVSFSTISHLLVATKIPSYRTCQKNIFASSRFCHHHLSVSNFLLARRQNFATVFVLIRKGPPSPSSFLYNA